MTYTATTTSGQLRCRSQLHGIKKQYNGTDCIEIRCKAKWCAERGTGTVVLHYFNVESGELVGTKKFRDGKEFLTGRREEKSP